ncbi:MAG: cation transporter [Lachnospiraceae bacterium]|nr:cation transporter [Lachnospiraceae bacterium]
MNDRNRVIVRTSIVGIITNVILVIFKLTVGFLSSSISVILDGVNNLTDAVSSIVTIVGTKLANRKPDKKHPLGHGRIEYITAMVVAAIIIYAGITAAKESVENIFNPADADYSIVSLMVILVAVAVKIILGTFVKKQGIRVKSGALEASGKDALFDAILSGSVLICALITYFTKFRLESYVGLIISGFIVKAGIEMMLETLDYILGKRADPETTKKIKEVICRSEPVRGAYDLFITNYGPERNYASVHIELPDTMSVEEVDILTRQIERNVYLETGVILTGIGVYSYNTKDDEASRIRNHVSEIVLANDWAIQMHGFYVDVKEKFMRFDTVLSFDISQKEGLEILNAAVAKEYPEYSIIITPDVDISD